MNLSQVRANESYGCNDLGRILYESEVNDMAFFEAILASDFREIQGLQEGTLLESEIKSLNEASFGTFISSMKERLKSFWAKIKAAFKDAMTKIAAYVFRDGKAFVKNFNTVCGKYKETWSGTVKDVKLYDSEDANDVLSKEINAFTGTIEKQINESIKTDKGSRTEFEDVTKVDLLKKIFKNLIGDDVEPSEFVKKFIEANEYTKDVGPSDIKKLCDLVSNGSSVIKSLKKTESAAKNSLDKMGKALATAETKGSDNAARNISVINLMVSTGESLITYLTKASIAMVKADVKSSRAALGQIMSDLRSTGTKKDKKAFGESCILEAAAEVDSHFDMDEELDADTQESIDEIISDSDDI
jgi:hypothetical protein